MKTTRTRTRAMTNNLSLSLFIILVSTLMLSTITTVLSPIQTSFAQASQPNHSRMIWRVGLSSPTMDEQRAFAESVLGGATSDIGSKDIIIIHYPVGGVPTSTEISALKAVTKVTDARKGFEFFNLVDLANGAAIAETNGLGIISYDLEAGASPTAETNDPLGSFQQARSIADAHGLALQAAPSHAISVGQYADDIAAIVNRYHIQSQPLQDDDTVCDIMRDDIASIKGVLEAANSNLEGRITYQVTLTNNAAPGKTFLETATYCVDLITNDDVDGMSAWWGSAQWNDLKTLTTHYEDIFS